MRSCILYVSYAAFLYLCLCEVTPREVSRNSTWLMVHWEQQQLLIICGTCIAVVILCRLDCPAPKPILHVERLLFALNTVPLASSAVCAAACAASSECGYDGTEGSLLSAVLDSLGITTARLARLQLGLSLLLIGGQSDGAWVFGATGGVLAYPEAIPLHRVAGWWCAFQSAFHSFLYVCFYLEKGGFQRLVRDCAPIPPTRNGELNRLGLINGFGVLAMLALMLLTLLALPRVRKQCYHIFAYSHLALGMLFVVCCALHDLPILLFAVPGLACWYLDAGVPGRELHAEVRVLSGTSGPWVELDMNTLSFPHSPEGPPVKEGLSTVAGPQWISIAAIPLGSEAHPLSVYPCIGPDGTQRLCATVSASAGDWSKKLFHRAQQGNQGQIKLRVRGPFPCATGPWSLVHSARQERVSLLLLAGGTGITGWLPRLPALTSGVARCRLIWCVREFGDYNAFASWLPSRGAVETTVYVTRGDCGGDALSPPRREQRSGAMPTPPVLRGRNDRRCYISLAAALVGLLVCHIMERTKQRSSLPSTLTAFALEHRLLPIALIALAIVAATFLGSKARPSSMILKCSPHWLRSEISSSNNTYTSPPRRRDSTR